MYGIPQADTFQSTLSVRRATVAHAELHNRLVISIHALRKESDYAASVHSAAVRISIHALRKESDYVFHDVHAEG